MSLQAIMSYLFDFSNEDKVSLSPVWAGWEVLGAISILWLTSCPASTG